MKIKHTCVYICTRICVYYNSPLSYSQFPALNVEQLSAAIDGLSQVVGTLSVQVSEVIVKHLTLNPNCFIYKYMYMYIGEI